MSGALEALNDAFDVLLGSNGEPLSFRDSEVMGLVDRAVEDRFARSPDFDLRDASEIRIRLSDVSTKPTASEEFSDTYGIIHRITSVKRLGEWYTCRCRVSDSAIDLIATEDPELFSTENGDALQAA